jgi:hypothetical protein
MSEHQKFRFDEEMGSHPTPTSLQAWVPTHDVQFYDTEAFLHGSVAGFLIEGVKLGQPFVVIATPAHREAYQAAMRARGVNPDHLRDGRDAVWLDARDTLASFMEGGKPSAELFDATVGNVFEKLRTDRRYVMTRAHGEMVDLLWREGRADAALRLEDLWNALAERYSFSLLCTYSRATLVSALYADGFERICGCHSRVLSSESSAA